MFTGLIETMGRVAELRPEPPGVRLVVESPLIASNAEMGASIAINGCCLTVVQIDGQQVHFEAGEETLKCTNLGRLEVGSPINLERSLKVGDSVGGHFVTGHVDAVGTVDERIDDGTWSTIFFRFSPPLGRQISSKGSIAVDGISLTLVDVEAERFSVALIPHTLEVTTLGSRAIGDEVNLETDLLAKYVEKQLAGQEGLTQK
jgi:riboflavin synthase